MQAHKALECIEEMRRKGRIDEQICSLVERALVESQKFEFEHDGLPDLCEADYISVMKDARLPFHLSYFSIPSIGGVLAKEHADCVLLQPFIQADGGGIGILPPEWNILIDKRDGTLCCRSSNPQMVAEWTHPTDPQVIYIIGLIANVMRGIAILNCSNVTTIEQPAPRSLNKKRKAKGKPQIFSFRTLHIKPSKQSSASALTDGLDRNSPRLHMRRGHIRRLASGVTTWVQSCMVGTASNGMVIKDYRVDA